MTDTGERPPLDETHLAPTWTAQLLDWFAQARADPDVVQPDAMQLATASGSGEVSVRTVLAKRIDERGLVFYSNYTSTKAVDLAANPRASAVFAWLAPQRQVRVTGVVDKLDHAETEAYFATRPRESQLGAWASPQSQVVASRAALDELYAATADRFGDRPVPVPPHWGGYLLSPDEVEFWQGRVARLHDRIRYRRGADGSWRHERLAP